MKTNIRVAMVCFLSLLFLTGCGASSTTDSVSNSVGPSSPSNIMMTVTLTPEAIKNGGQTLLTVTLRYANTGTPAAGHIVVLLSSVAGSGDDFLTSGSTGLAQWVITAESDTPITYTAVVENISTSIRLNIIS